MSQQKVENIHTGQIRKIVKVEMIAVESFTDEHPVYVFDDQSRHNEDDMNNWKFIIDEAATHEPD